MDRSKPPVESTVVMEGVVMGEHLQRLAREIVAANEDPEALVILGILRRGRPIAERFATLIEDLTGVRPPVGSLATTLYRDDVKTGRGIPAPHGQTYFDFNVDEQTVLLVDDVLAAGRTIRAAMDEVMDYGRPARIQLACLVDRGGRELPIQADYLGWSTSAARDEWVSVHLVEIDGEDAVLVERYPAAEATEGN